MMASDSTSISTTGTLGPLSAEGSQWGEQGLRDYITSIAAMQERVPDIQQRAHDESLRRNVESFGREREDIERMNRNALRQAAAAQGMGFAQAMGGAGMAPGGGAAAASMRQLGRAFGETASDRATAAALAIGDLENRQRAADQTLADRRVQQQMDWETTLQEAALGTSAAEGRLYDLTEGKAQDDLQWIMQEHARIEDDFFYNSERANELIYLMATLDPKSLAYQYAWNAVLDYDSDYGPAMRAKGFVDPTGGSGVVSFYDPAMEEIWRKMGGAAIPKPGAPVLAGDPDAPKFIKKK